MTQLSSLVVNGPFVLLWQLTMMLRSFIVVGLFKVLYSKIRRRMANEHAKKKEKKQKGRRSGYPFGFRSRRKTDKEEMDGCPQNEMKASSFFFCCSVGKSPTTTFFFSWPSVQDLIKPLHCPVMIGMTKDNTNTNANANVNVNAMQCAAMLCHVCQHSLSSLLTSPSPWQVTLFVQTLLVIRLEIGSKKQVKIARGNKK